MNYEKTILCLANSRKPDGRCIAGKEVRDGEYGDWIRPVSKRPSEEISLSERRYESGQDPQVLDIISIPMLEPRPASFQVENHLIDNEFYWEKVDHVNWQDVKAAVDVVSGPLWINRFSTWEGQNDKVPEAQAEKLASSLLLIHPDTVRIHVGREGGVYAPAKRKVRASFEFNGQSYLFAVTHPSVERRYLSGQDGEFTIDQAILCVSLSKIWNGFGFKLIAGVITPDM